jgi:hypothetical protein
MDRQGLRGATRMDRQGFRGATSHCSPLSRSALVRFQGQGLGFDSERWHGGLPEARAARLATLDALDALLAAGPVVRRAAMTSSVAAALYGLLWEDATRPAALAMASPSPALFPHRCSLAASRPTAFHRLPSLRLSF